MVEKTETFASRVERLKGDLSYQELSDAIFAKTGVRISPQAMNKWVIQDGGISVENAKVFAGYFGKTAGWLVFGEGEENAATEDIGDAIHALPDEAQQQVFDFIEYKFEKADGLIASDQMAKYTRMIESFKKDLERRRKGG